MFRVFLEILHQCVDSQTLERICLIRAGGTSVQLLNALR